MVLDGMCTRVGRVSLQEEGFRCGKVRYREAGGSWGSVTMPDRKPSPISLTLTLVLERLDRPDVHC